MKLTDTAIKIVTVHPSGTVRNLINTELRNRGYTDVLGAPDLQTVVGILETGLIHWLIAPIMMDDKINSFQILKLITEDPTMMDMRLSFMVDASSDPGLISKAFDMGLLSLHRHMASKADIEEEFKMLFSRDVACGGELSLVAAEYLRQFLKDEKRHAELLRFEKALFQFHVGNLKLLLHLAEAHLLNGQVEPALNLFSQALLVDATLEPEINTLCEKFPEARSQGQAEAAARAPEVLGIRSCLVVEPDPETLNLIVGLLKQLGVQNIYTFQDPTQAEQWLDEKIVPELVILEWRLPQMPGPILVQKLRTVLGFGVPLTVMNKDLTERDMPVLHEMGVTDRIRKPIEPQAFFQDVIWVINQDRSPSEPVILLQKIRQAMADQNFEKLAAFTKRYMDSDKSSEAEKSLLQAELAYYRGHYPTARNLALNVLKSGLASVEVLNLLGKTMMKLRDFTSALCCLENAEVICPSNVKRICNIAEAHLEMGEQQGFRENLDAAKAIAPTASEVTEVEVKGALVNGEGDKAHNLMKSLQSLLSIVSFTNNRAISLIRTDRFEEGLQLYNEALQAVPENRNEVLAILHYNQGLALARANRLDEAKAQMEAAAALKSDKIRSKVTSLKGRIQKAIDTQQKLELTVCRENTPEAVSTDPQKDYEELMMALKINPGDLCCHKIYFEPVVSPELKDHIDRPLRFKKRSSIQREAPGKAS
ncbi:response regulator [Oligoflexus tunisiensis]|uniref:response regulator n=1 Tax=Oligoflexus tunisiensis TaxID=708132 RepID=UPI00114C8E4C|nr:response regulator [Oligoflexus tunisiensis]